MLICLSQDIQNSKLSASMKARLSFGGSTPQKVDHQVPKDQESVDSNSQDDLLYDE
jgi:hypothetical protein